MNEYVGPAERADVQLKCLHGVLYFIAQVVCYNGGLPTHLNIVIMW